MRDITYEGRVYQQEKVLHYRKAGPGDVKELAELYRRISIDRYNNTEKLGNKGPGNFEHTGGMFLIMGEQQIRRELENPHSFWGILRDEKEKLLAGFWFSNQFPELSGWAGDRDSVVYPVELTAAPEERGRQIGKLMYYTIFKAMNRAGFERSICDVYRVSAFENQKGRQEVSLMNMPSRRTIEQIGGRFLGMAPEKHIKLPGFQVWVSPMIFELEYRNVLPICERILERKGILAAEGKE